MIFRRSFRFLQQNAFPSPMIPCVSFLFSTTHPPKPVLPLKSQKQMKERELSEKLKTQLKASFVEVIDTSNSGCKYNKYLNII